MAPPKKTPPIWPTSKIFPNHGSTQASSDPPLDPDAHALLRRRTAILTTNPAGSETAAGHNSRGTWPLKLRILKYKDAQNQPGLFNQEVGKKVNQNIYPRKKNSPNMGGEKLPKLTRTIKKTKRRQMRTYH